MQTFWFQPTFLQKIEIMHYDPRSKILKSTPHELCMALVVRWGLGRMEEPKAGKVEKEQ